MVHAEVTAPDAGPASGDARRVTAHWDTPDLRLASLGHALVHRARTSAAPGWPADGDHPEHPGEHGGDGIWTLSLARPKLDDEEAGRGEAVMAGPGDRPPAHLQRLLDGVVGESALDEVALVRVGGGHREPATLGELGLVGTSLRAVEVGPASTVDELVRAAVVAATRQLLVHDPHLRLDAPVGSIHKARVATRRLRSDLRTLAPVLDAERTARVRDELQWLAGLLGAVRDVDVLGQHLETWLGELHDGEEHRAGRAGSGPSAGDGLADELAQRLHQQRTAGVTALCDSLVAARYHDLVADLRAWAEQPPWAEGARPDEAAVDLGLARVRHADRRVRRLVDHLDEPPTTEALHEVRKAAKRCRYACELVSPLVEGSLDDLAAEMAALQEVLGGLQDTAVARAWLGGLAFDELTPEQAFTIGRLAQLTERSAIDALRRWEDQWKRTRRRKLRPWA